MKKPLLFLAAVAVLVLAAWIARSRSPGIVLEHGMQRYLAALARGESREAWNMLTDSLALLVSPEFLGRLEGVSPPGRVFRGGEDHRGIRMSMADGSGRREVWFQSTPRGYRVRGDALLDRLLGEAVLLCRAAAAAGVPACPVSGREYLLDGDVRICPAGHLGGGLSLSPEPCALRRDSVTAEVRRFIASGYGDPPDLESLFMVSEGQIGRRGGWRCPDNAYTYYQLRNDSVYCRWHDASTPVNP